MYKISIERILDIIDSKINYLSKVLNYPEAKTDLIIYILNIYNKIDFSRFNKEEELKYYLHKCLINERNRLFIKIKKYREKEFISSDHVDINMNMLSNAYKFSTDIYFFDLISKLPNKQKKVIYYKYYMQLSDIEIAKILDVSRQSVNKTKKLALINLKKNIEI